MRRISSRIPINIVLGLMIVFYPVARSADARQMLSCQLAAWYDLMPKSVMPGVRETSSNFFIVGKCTFPAPGFSIELRPHNRPSSDPKILLLDAIVHEPTNPAPRVPTDVPLRYNPLLKSFPNTGTLYEKVIILPDKLVLTVGKAY